MSNDDADIETMLRLKGGEDLALNELMERWQKPLVGFILRHAGNEQDALDLAQETFVRVFENRDRYEPRSKFSTWLFTIATNLCRNQARWRVRHPTVTLNGSPLRAGKFGTLNFALNHPLRNRTEHHPQ